MPPALTTHDEIELKHLDGPSHENDLELGHVGWITQHNSAKPRVSSKLIHKKWFKTTAPFNDHGWYHQQFWETRA